MLTGRPPQRKPLTNLSDLAIKNAFEGQFDAGWSSLVARRAHNPKVGGSNPPPATKIKSKACKKLQAFLISMKLPFQPLLKTFTNNRITH